MSNWMVTNGVFQAWDYDCNHAKMRVEQYGEGMIIYMDGILEEGRQEKPVTTLLPLFGRNLYAFLEYIKPLMDDPKAVAFREE